MKRILFCTSALAIASLVHPLVANAQRTSPPADQPRRTQQQSGAPDLAAQIAELRSAVARLEASIAANQQPGTTTPAPGGTQGMGGMKGGTMGRMPAGGAGMGAGMRGGGMGGGMGKGGAMKGGMMDEMGEMAPMSPGGAGGMAGMEGMDAGEMSMEMGGMMGMMGMGSMSPQGGSGLRASSLPGFPGASHIYHVGATGFFLDHSEHVSLETAQQQELNRLKQGALLAKASTQRKINEAEQQLWELTSADEPDADQIQAKVEEIAKLRAQQRLDFIRAVGEAAKVLTDEQRQILLGVMQPGAPPKQPKDHQAHSQPGK